VDGFPVEAKLMTEYYQKHLGEQETNRTPVLQKIMEEGLCLIIEQ